MSEFQQYTAEIQRSLDALPWDAIQDTVSLLYQAWVSDQQLFIMGNGGSASTASHMACDLSKNTAMPGRPSFRVTALTDNMALFSAYANDEGYENVFAGQLATFLRRGDVVLAISTSGNSPNVLRGIDTARRAGAITVGWSGFDGGALAAMVDVPLLVRNDCVEQIEDIHLILEHMVTVSLRRAIRSAVPMAPSTFVSDLWARRPDAALNQQPAREGGRP